jgi:hypothetical protein
VFSIQNKRKTLSWKSSQIFLCLKSVFLLTNFSNSKQTQESLEKEFQETTFRANKRPLNVKEILLHIKSFSSLKKKYINVYFLF